VAEVLVFHVNVSARRERRLAPGEIKSLQQQTLRAMGLANCHISNTDFITIKCEVLSRFALTRIVSLFNLDVLSDVATLHESAYNSSYRADSDFLMFL